jgi:adenine C2-methylase RlmN of 23S rRNA A2503 and tRNA A37
MMKLNRSKSFKNGSVFALITDDDYPVEVTDTFLPFYTKDAVGVKQNSLTSDVLGDRSERWMIGVSCMSGCPVRCKFCATGQLSKWRKLTAEEIVEQVDFVLQQNPDINFNDAKEHKINYTRMGEPFLNIEAVKKAIEMIEERFPGTHHYVSTIGMKNSDFTWIKDNVTLQISLHSLDENRRDDLIPVSNKMALEELGKVRTESDLKTTLNMTLVDEDDFDIDKLKELFDPESFFVKLSPINPNCVSDANEMGPGIITAKNLA